MMPPLTDQTAAAFCSQSAHCLVGAMGSRRNSLRPEYKRKIENMVRKPDRDAEDEEEPAWPCPFCRTPGPESDLECHHCKDVIPFCIATGKRCIVSDWARCPSCQFNCRAQDFVKVLLADKACPMCNEQVWARATSCVRTSFPLS